MTHNSPPQKMKQEYVVGFNFVQPADDCLHVVLIMKRRPDWQRGKLNGVGGHVEPGELPLDAMRREYSEETGDSVSPSWTLFLTQEFDDCVVHFFKSLNSTTTARTVTDETVYIIPLSVAPDHKILPNLHWLLPMARFSDDGGYLKYKSCN